MNLHQYIHSLTKPKFSFKILSNVKSASLMKTQWVKCIDKDGYYIEK